MLDDDETGLYGESASTRERTQTINSITLNKTKTLQFERFSFADQGSYHPGTPYPPIFRCVVVVH